jgi:hypothetical protein
MTMSSLRIDFGFWLEEKGDREEWLDGEVKLDGWRLWRAWGLQPPALGGMASALGAEKGD